MKFVQWKSSISKQFSAMNLSFDSKAGDSELPTNAEEKDPKIDLAGSKTYEEEEEEEPEVEVNISRSGEPFILNEVEKSAADESEDVTKQARRWNPFRRGEPTQSSQGRKIPLSMPGWTKEVPNTFVGWSRRERILLIIAVLNTLLVFGLLGSNVSMANQRRNRTSVSAASKNEDPGECDGKGKKCGGKGESRGVDRGKGDGRGKKSKGDSGDNAVGSDEGDTNDGTTTVVGGGGWKISTNTSLAGGNPATASNPSTVSAPPPPMPVDNAGPAPEPMTEPVPTPATPNDTPTAIAKPVTEQVLGDPDAKCGCPTCTESIWNEMAGPYTCGDRISYLATEFPLHYPTQVHACRQIAFEFPCICGGCDPGRCSIGTSEFVLPSNWQPSSKDRFGAEITPAPTPVTAATDTSVDLEDQVLYCFPSPEARKTYTLWGGMVVQPKEDAGNCGPGNNRFSSSNAIVDEAANTLTLVHTAGTSAEVRVLLPKESRPFTYGTYSFSVKSVEVKDTTGSVLSNILPKELILGLFSWDDTGGWSVNLRRAISHDCRFRSQLSTL
jgi:hypothetical protein